MNNVRQMRKLVTNELYKMFLQKKTIIFIVIMLAFVGIHARQASKHDKKDWRAETQHEIEVLKNSIEQTKQEVAEGKALPAEEQNDITIELGEGILISQEDQVKLLEYRLENDIPDNVMTPIRFVYESNFFISLIVIFMAVFAANIVSLEYTQGTIRQVLIKPVKRWKVYLSKYIASILVSVILCLILYLFSAILGFILFSGNSSSIYEAGISNGSIYVVNMLKNTVLSTLCNMFTIAIVITVGFCIATVVRTNTLAILGTLGVYFIGIIIGGLWSNKWFYKYLLTPNLSIENYLPGGMVPFEGATLGFSMAVCAVYFVVLYMTGNLLFSKRDVY